MVRRRSRFLLALSLIGIGFLVAVAVQARPADPEARVPERYRLAALIQREQELTTDLRREVDLLRADVERLVSAAGSREAGAAARERELSRATMTAGLVAVRGPGLQVTLDDSLLEEAPSGDVNDLVIHSQDVQAVVNAVWRAGAEAVSINGQRLVSTSAVLCVGNTLLLNGTVHSPPYTVSAVGAVRDRFEADPLVERLHEDAKSYGLRFAVTRHDDVEVPAYQGATTLSYARPKA